MSKLLEKIKSIDPSKVEPIKAKLAKNKTLVVKYGIDPTTEHVHLGHTVPLRLLKLFQDEGHTAVIVMGDFTASIGDPTGRNELRSKSITIEEARVNANKYLDQIGKVIDISKAKVHENSNWFDRCDLRWVLSQLKNFTASQILDREDFSNRLKSGSPIQMSELLYPLLQGHDSVVLNADVELGATEQLFNLNVGRDMQRMAGQEPQICITLPILKGLDGVKKMGKSLNNYIAVNDVAFEMYSKVMSIPDLLMDEWVQLLTDDFSWAEHPMENKKQLAGLIVEQFHGTEKAIESHDEWVKQFTQRKAPTEVPVVVVPSAEALNLSTMIHFAGHAPSKNEARRLVSQGAVDINGNKVFNPSSVFKNGDRIRVGRKYFDIKLE